MAITMYLHNDYTVTRVNLHGGTMYLHSDYMVTTVHHLQDNYMMTRVHPHGDYRVKFCQTLRLEVGLRASNEWIEINNGHDSCTDQQLAQRAQGLLPRCCAVMVETQSLRPT